MMLLPTSTVTFLFTDIQGSTQLWEQRPEAMQSALARRDAILREAIEAHEGRVIKTTGDDCHAVFASTANAATAVLAAQRHLQSPISNLQIRVRMALHTGEAEARAGDYFGQALNQAARLTSIGHSGQIRLSPVMADLGRDQLPGRWTSLSRSKNAPAGFAIQRLGGGLQIRREQKLDLLSLLLQSCGPRAGHRR